MAPDKATTVAMDRSEQPATRTEGARIAYDGSWHDIQGFEALHRSIKEAQTPSADTSWADIMMGTCGVLGDGVIGSGNAKLHRSVGVFSIGPATHCVNRFTSNCQVDGDECYAVVTENNYTNPLHSRIRKEYFWDNIDADTFADAFLRTCERKNKPYKSLRFNVAGDVRYRGDAVKMDRIAERLGDHGIDVYLYTASDFVDFRPFDNLVVNASNPAVRGADRRYIAVGSEAEIPDDGFQCPANYSDTQCGECQACVRPEGEFDVYSVIH